MKRQIQISLLFFAVSFANVSYSVAFSLLEYEVLRIEDTRDLNNTRLTEIAFQEEDLPAARRAVLAMGRLEDNRFLAPLSELLFESETPSIRALAAFGLGQMQNAEATNILLSALENEASSIVRAALLKAIGHSLQRDSVSALTTALMDPRESLTAKVGAAQGIGVALTFLENIVLSPALKLTLLNLSRYEGRLGNVASFAWSRLKEESRFVSFEDFLRSYQQSSISNRPLLLRTLSYQNPTSALYQFLGETALRRDQGESLRISALRVLARLEFDEQTFEALLTDVAKDFNWEPYIMGILELVEAWQVPLNAFENELQKLISHHPSIWLKSKALDLLRSRDREEARSLTHQFLDSEEFESRLMGLRSLVHFSGNEEDRDLFLSYLESDIPEYFRAASSVLSLGHFEENDRLLYALRVALYRGDLSTAYSIASFAKTLQLESLADDLENAYYLFDRPEDVEAKVALLEALAELASEDHMDTLFVALRDETFQVSRAAVAALLSVSGEDYSDQVSQEVPLRIHTPSFERVKRAIKARVFINTTKGSLTVRLHPFAPLSAAHFLRWADEGYYDSLKFHRVITNSVAQGGDPRGDGFGGPGHFIRDEYSPLWHERGALGIATAGRDTGGSQFFINQSSNLYLDGRYTVFAHVIKGDNVIDTLAQGDEILSMKVID